MTQHTLTMAGRPKIFNEQKALERATALFWQKGYEATSTQDLIDTMGLQRGSLYHSFGSKKQLFQNAIDQHERSFTEFEKAVRESADPIPLIKSVFLELADCSDDDHRKGCFLGNTVAELSGTDEELATRAKEHLASLERMLFEQIKRAQDEGTLKNQTDAKLLARYLLNLWNGINITRRIHPSKEVLRPLIEFQLSILE